MNVKVKADVNGLNAAELVAKSKGLVRSMTGNVNFPTTTPDLADITAKQEELLDLIAQVENKERNAVANRNACIVELKAILTKLGVYVNLTGDGNERILETSGFELYKQPEPAGPLMPPVNVVATRTTHNGRVEVSWSHVKGGKCYQILMTSDDPTSPTAAWITVAATNKSKAIVDNLTPGVKYSFKVKAIGSRDESGYSDAAIVMAA